MFADVLIPSLPVDIIRGLLNHLKTGLPNLGNLKIVGALRLRECYMPQLGEVKTRCCGHFNWKGIKME